MRSAHQLVCFDCYLAVMLVGYGFSLSGCRQYLFLASKNTSYGNLQSKGVE